MKLFSMKHNNLIHFCCIAIILFCCYCCYIPSCNAQQQQNQLQQGQKSSIRIPQANTQFNIDKNFNINNLIKQLQNDAIKDIDNMPSKVYDYKINIKIPPPSSSSPNNNNSPVLSIEQYNFINYKIKQIQNEIQIWGNVEFKLFLGYTRSLLIIPDFVAEVLHQISHYMRIVRLKKDLLNDHENNQQQWFMVEFSKDEEDMRIIAKSLLYIIQNIDDIKNDVLQSLNEIGINFYNFLFDLFYDTFVWDFIVDIIGWLLDLIHLSNSPSEFNEKINEMILKWSWVSTSTTTTDNSNNNNNQQYFRQHPIIEFARAGIPGIDTLFDIYDFSRMNDNNNLSNWTGVIKVIDLETLSNSLLSIFNTVYNIIDSYIFPIIKEYNIQQYLPFQLPTQDVVLKVYNLIQDLEKISQKAIQLLKMANVTQIDSSFDFWGIITNAALSIQDDADLFVFVATYYEMTVDIGLVLLKYDPYLATLPQSALPKLPSFEQFIINIGLPESVSNRLHNKQNNQN